MFKELEMVKGKTIAGIIPIKHQFQNNPVSLQIIFNDDSEIIVYVDEGSLKWNIR